jgi:quercetin dioxygenase-like cupin family protein
MQLLSFGPERATPIREYLSQHASAVALASGQGEAHVYCVHLDAGGEIGAHEAGFAQLFLVVEGSGWVSGSDGRRQPLGQGQGALIARGEVHAKGTAWGMTAIMVQVTDMSTSCAAGAI